MILGSVKWLLFAVFLCGGNIFCMEQNKKLIAETKKKIVEEQDKKKKKELNKYVTTLKLQQKELKRNELEEKYTRLSVYRLLGAGIKNKKNEVRAAKIFDKNNRWLIDDVRLSNSGKYVVWSGRYERSGQTNVGLARVFKIDNEKKCSDYGSVGISVTQCDAAVTIFKESCNEKKPIEIGFFSNGMQCKKEYGMVRWCASYSDIKKQFFNSLYYDVALDEGHIGAGEFFPGDDLLAFSRGPRLFFHKKTDDTKELVNNTMSLRTSYGDILDVQFFPNGSRVALMHEYCNGISLHKTLSTKMDRLQLHDDAVLKEFLISPNSKSLATISSTFNNKIVVTLYDAEKLQLKVVRELPGMLYNDSRYTRKSYFSENGALVVPLVDEGNVMTVLLDGSSLEIIKTIVHGSNKECSVFKIVGTYGTYIKDNKKKVLVFDIRKSDTVDKIDVKHVPEFAFMSPQGYIITASKEGEQPNVQVYKYNN